MKVSEYGSTGIQVSRLGLGTNRFKISNQSSSADLDRAVQIAEKALQSGVNYIDTSYTYSKGMAEKILSIAMHDTKKIPNLVIKSAVNIDTTSDAVLKRIEESLKALGVPKAAFFLAWTISSYEEYRLLLKKGGYYEGAVRAKNRGLIDHICFATHCPPSESIKIIREGAFEGITVNYSVTNYLLNVPVIEAAAKKHMGVTAMSVLGTGTIAKNPKFFDFLRMNEEETVPQAALRFAAANQKIQVVLTGASSLSQISSNIRAFQEEDPYSEERISTIQNRIDKQRQLCTGCGKCTDVCPEKISVSTLMQCYNGKYYVNTEKPLYRRTKPYLLESIEIFKMMSEDYSYLLPDLQNRCTFCKSCENSCPEHLPIIKTIADLYERAEKGCYTKQSWRERLKEVFSGHQKIGLYPAGGYTGYILKYYHRLIGNLKSEIFMFDSNPAMWGQMNCGIIIRSPDEILKVHPECVIITNYIYEQEIREQIQYLEKYGIQVLPFHKPNDIPWVF